MFYVYDYNLIICENHFDRYRIMQIWDSLTDGCFSKLRFNIDVKLFEIDYKGATLYGIRIIDKSVCKHIEHGLVKYYLSICMNSRVGEVSDLIRNVTHYWNDDIVRVNIRIKLPEDIITNILKEDGINNINDDLCEYWCYNVIERLG